MNTEILLKEFQEILAREEKAKHFYDHYVDCVDDEGIKRELTSIRDDEIGHIKIAKRLIEYIS